MKCYQGVGAVYKVFSIGRRVELESGPLCFSLLCVDLLGCSAQG